MLTTHCLVMQSIASFHETHRSASSWKDRRPLHIVLCFVCLSGFFLFVTTLSVLLKPDADLTRAREKNSSNADSFLTSSLLPSVTPSRHPSRNRATTTQPTPHPSTTQPSLHHPNQEPSLDPSFKPHTLPQPSWMPTHLNPSTTSIPTGRPSSHTSPPTLTPATYTPGNLTVYENKLLLSEGLTAKVIALSGAPVEYIGGERSELLFHPFPDFGATFADPKNPGGWIYVSNSEVRKKNFTEFPQKGGVGAFTFDKDGNVVDYRMILNGTEANCGGGRTSWGTWISCEEHPRGVLWQVDPTGEREARRITLGLDGGQFESFAYDERNSHYFVTEDAERGALRRFTPNTTDAEDPWEILHGPGETEFLLLIPEDENSGTYNWTKDHKQGKMNAQAHYRNSEGIDVSGNLLFFVSKHLKLLFTLDLDTGKYTSTSTVSGLFDGAPDQLQRIVGPENSDELMYFTEEGGVDPGIHARNANGNFFTILESPDYEDETSGLAFSPDGRHLYFAFQNNGVVFDIARLDGLPFNARTLNVRYHADPKRRK